jgi:hypothetical protein
VIIMSDRCVVDLDLLEEMGFTRCYFLELDCRRCGVVRTAQRFLPDSAFLKCGICGENCRSGRLRVKAYTKQTLPVWEVWPELVSPYKLRLLLLERGQRLSAARSQPQRIEGNSHGA